ncbi:unnamed protein product [Fraxinus pennsylvanica]|uniref:HMA domain-containing protein n=1 Tax=Fraxinus pennsylvanica TaxID=56036 RepID=A0AAD2E0X2_9LAMI|nr:unnamed protein product [Fraxinus pennsylvanica]
MDDTLKRSMKFKINLKGVRHESEDKSRENMMMLVTNLRSTTAVQNFHTELRSLRNRQQTVEEFSWEDVKADKHHENYLGHSLKAPVGRSQKASSPMASPMADEPTHLKIVVKVNLNCCKASPKKLEKALLKLTGVSSFTINIEENLVSVSGTVRPDTIIKLIYAKLAKKAELVSYEPQSTKDDGVKPKNTNTEEEDKDLNNKSKSQHKGKMHKSCCCQDGKCPKMENNVHKCEEYAGPPEVKDFVCRDYFCKIHPRNRTITNKVPENESSARLYGYMPNYAQGYNGGPNPWYPIRGSYYPRWYPERPPALYEYYQPPRRPPPSYASSPMVDEPTHPNIAVKVNLTGCKASPKKLEKALLKLTASSPMVDETTHPNIVVKVNLNGCKASPKKLEKALLKLTAKKAELVSYEPQSTKDDEVKPKNTNTEEEDKDLNNKSKSQHKEKMYKFCCCRDGKCPKMEILSCL